VSRIISNRLIFIAPLNGQFYYNTNDDTLYKRKCDESQWQVYCNGITCNESTCVVRNQSRYVFTLIGRGLLAKAPGKQWANSGPS